MQNVLHPTTMRQMLNVAYIGFYLHFAVRGSIRPPVSKINRVEWYASILYAGMDLCPRLISCQCGENPSSWQSDYLKAMLVEGSPISRCAPLDYEIAAGASYFSLTHLELHWIRIE